MARRPDFQPWERNGKWIVSVPASLSGDGKRRRRTFDSETAARKAAAKLRAAHDAGHRGSVIPLTLALQAQEAMRILEGTGIGLVDAARRAADAVQGDRDGETFRQRYRRALAAMDTLWSDRYCLDMEKVPRWVPAWFLAQPCGMIDRPMMERALTEERSLSRSTIDTRCRYLSAVIGFRERHRKGEEIQILTVAQCARLLRACETPGERMAIALLLFAGIRPDPEHGEISRLNWSAVGEREIYLSRGDSKVSDRHIPITPRLERLLRGHPESGPVVPANWRRVYRRIRAAVPEIHGKQDVMRHTFASHFLAAFGEDAAKAAMGHAEGSRTLFRHYRAAVTAEAGRRYFR